MTDPWAAPDVPADDGHALVVPLPATTRTGLGRPGPTAGADIAPELPVPLRPMTPSDRLDGALRILKLAPGPVIALAAVAVVPLQLIGLLALGRSGVDDGDAVFEAFVGRAGVRLFVTDSGGDAAIAIVLLLLEALAVSFVACGIGSLVSGWYFGGRRSTPADVVGFAARRLPALAAAWFLVHVAEAALAVAFIIPALVPMTWFALTAPIIGIEQLGPIKAMRRSMGLARRAFGTVLGTCLLVAVLDAGLRFSLSAIGGIYADIELPAAWAVTTATSIAARLVTVSFVAGVAVLLHLDLRIRLEGLDIQLAADERFPRAP
jgi:hypothetical protein